MHRRDLLATIGATAAGGAVATPASAEDHWPWQSSEDTKPQHLSEGKPKHVSISFPESAMQNYQPKLVIRHLSIPPKKQFGWLAQSREYEYDVYCYWTFYSRQEGLTGRDSHWLDREPCYVFVDKHTGDVETVVYSAYHWYSNRALPVLAEDSHPQFRVADNWHHYIQTPAEGQLVEPLVDFRGQFAEWLRNGWDESLAVGVAQDPARMLTRETWFRRDAGTITGVNIDEAIAATYLNLGIRGADSSDLT